MSNRFWAVAAPCWLLAVLVGCQRGRLAVQASGVELIPVGGLGIGDDGDAYCFDLNSAGTIVGMTGTRRTFTWQNGVTTWISLNATGQAYMGTSIDELGRVAGVIGDLGADFETLEAARYDRSGWQRIGFIGAGVESLALKTGPSGIVVGRSQISAFDGTTPPSEHAFRYDGTNLEDLGTLGGSDSRAYGANAQGDVVGISGTSSDANNQNHAFLYTDAAGMTDLGAFPDGTDSSAAAINSSRQVVGSALTSQELYRAVLFDQGSVVDLGTLGGDNSLATAIDDDGRIVGYSETSDGSVHPFVSTGGALVDLLGGSDDDWISARAESIRLQQDGTIRIVGWGKRFNDAQDPEVKCLSWTVTP